MAALKPQLSFSGGELDPILNDRATLERFQNALATARNVLIGKSGTMMSRFGRFFFGKSEHDQNPINIFCPENTGIFLELGMDDESGGFANSTYCKIWNFDGTLLHKFSNLIGMGGQPAFDAETLPKLHFVTSGKFVYIFGGYFGTRYEITVVPLQPNDSNQWVLDYSGSFFLVPSTIVANSAVASSSGSGYEIEYAWTAMYNGQETIPKFLNFSPVQKRPVNIAEVNELTINVGSDPANIDFFNEIRIYQRPKEGAGYGFLGRTTQIYVDSGIVKAKFKDLGANPDYTNGLPVLITQEGLSEYDTLGQNEFLTGIVYQQRMLLGNCVNANPETILASRPGYKNNFYRDEPYDADSALNFKAGTTGNAEVLRMIESDGLVVFTSAGVYVNGGVLNPDNLAMVRRGPWVIDIDLPPLVIPGGLFFVDKITSSVRLLIYSQELGTYEAQEQSIFSDHLFKTRTIKSWCYQQGSVPLLIVVFNDGNFATFTYSFEHQLKAWTRHDSIYPIEKVVGTGINDTSIFVINKDGNRQIELTVPRRIPSTVYASNPEANMTAYGAFMDGLKVQVTLVNKELANGDELEIEPVVADEWGGQLQINCGTSHLFFGTHVGDIYRWFNPKDHASIDFLVVTVNFSDEIIVEPSEIFPEQYADGFRMYLTHTTVYGLEHLEGEEVSVMCDGSMVSSPFNDNDEDTMTILTVIGGQIDLPEPSAISIVGRPIVADIKTLNITTAEQSPTTIESLTVDKLYIRLFESIGLFVSNKFPEEEQDETDGTSVKGMQPLYEQEVPNGSPIIGNRGPQPISKRIERTLPGEWESNGQISMRQVDPFHFEILSIIADIEILKRSDR